MKLSISINEKTTFILEWISTVVLIVGVALTAYNVYPLNIWISMIGNFGWFIVGALWKKWSLVIIQIVITAIYIAGLFNV